MICRWAIAATLAACAVAAAADEPSIAERQALLSAKFAAELDTLAEKCDELELSAQAEQTRNWAAPRKSGRIVLHLSDRQAADLPASAEQRVKQWHARFMEIRRLHAAAVFELAAEAASAEQGELAMKLIYEVIHENPDHVEAQRFLGIKRSVTRTPKVMAGVGVHRKFGWKSGKHWSLDTPHFKIETSAGIKECNELGRELEQLHDIWQQWFFALWGDNRLLAGRFRASEVELTRPKRFHVVLFKDRDEYLTQLGKDGAAAAASSGFYSDEQKMSLFFAGEAKRSTRYHEVTHQLIQEYLEAPAGIAKDDNVWMVEAAALFMETLVLRDGCALLGGYDADNLQFARFRARGGDFQMPLADLSKLGRDALQTHPDVKKIYGQLGGLGQFFMEGREGDLREPFLKALLGVYQGRADAGTLAMVCGTTYDKLDQQYYDFLDVTDAMIVRTPPLPGIRGLSLRKTSVTDAGLAAFKECDQLQFLDLSLTATGDEGLAAFPPSKTLTTLFLERTKISDAALEDVGRFPSLEELYLSGAAISDAGLEHLAPLRRLKVLDLSGCNVTDTCLPALAALKQLESLDTSGTKITSAGLTKLKRSLPKLKQ